MKNGLYKVTFRKGFPQPCFVIAATTDKVRETIAEKFSMFNPERDTIEGIELVATAPYLVAATRRRKPAQDKQTTG